MPYSLKQAAAACGKSKSTVYEALTSNRLKHTKDDKGRFIIEADDLNTVFPKQSENVYSEREKTPLNDDKHSLFLQTIESLKDKVTALEADRDRWHEQAKDAAHTIEQQAAALAAATVASARAITQADEIRRRMEAIEAPKQEAKASAEPEPRPAAEPEPANQNAPALKPRAIRPWLWVVLVIAGIFAAAITLLQRTGKF
jgi:hypothetical protein